MRKLLFLSLLTAFCALPAADDRRPEFFVGYSNLQAEGLPERNTTTGSFSDGLNVAATAT